MGFGNRVYVLGAGPISLLAASCARLFGAPPGTVSDPSDARAAAAAERGFKLVETAAEDHSCGVVFDCTGHPSASPGVLGWAATGGVVVTSAPIPRWYASTFRTSCSARSR